MRSRPTVAINLSDRRKGYLKSSIPDARIVDTAADFPWTVPAEAAVLVSQETGWSGAPVEAPSGWPHNLEWLHLVSAGIDSYPKWIVDVPVVTCGRHVNSRPIAEYALAAILNAEKNLADARVVQAEDWHVREMGTLHRKTLGLVGVGAIGAQIARLGQAFGMHVKAVRRRAAADGDPSIELLPSLHDLISQSDHFVICAPLTAETYHLLDSDVLAAARQGIHIINVSRGALLDEKALLAALSEGVVGRATLDVLEREPPFPDNPLLLHPAVHITPHISWIGGDTDQRIVSRVTDNYLRWQNGEPLKDQVDKLTGY